MKVERFLPSPALKPYVKAYLIIESDAGAENRTLPDTSVVLAFRYAGHVTKRNGSELENIPAAAISGLTKSARYFTYAANSGNVLVILREGGIAAFPGLPAHELFGINVSATELFPPDALREALDQLAAARSHRHRIGVIERFLFGQLTPRQPDQLVASAIQTINLQHGHVRIRELAASLYISQDAFEKRFRNLAGASPKQYASIIRLRKLIANYPSTPSLTAVSYDAGYFDQAHFIKDFKRFTDQSPKDFFQSPPSW